MALLCVAAMLICIDSSTAASRSCRQLEARLASLDRGGRASPAQLGKYDSAIARQSEEIGKARSRARRAGCGFSIFGRNIAACASLNASIDRMNANLDTLRSQRARLSKGATRGERARVKAALAAKDCRGVAVAEKRLIERRPAAHLFSDEPANEPSGDPELSSEQNGLDDGSYLDQMAELNLEPAPQPQGEFRTMCVRTCDGYFYPVSNAASLRDFERDQKNCESSCPGTRMEVFYTNGIGDDPANMVSSATGRPYSELRTAYLYKKPGTDPVPACGCNAARDFQIIGGNTSAPAQQSTVASSSITSFVSPKPKPDVAREKPADPAGSGIEQKEKPAGRNVRVVAPAFLPDPKAAIDLRVQAPRPAP